MSSNRNLYEPKRDFYQTREQFSSYSELVLSHWSDPSENIWQRIWKQMKRIDHLFIRFICFVRFTIRCQPESIAYQIPFDSESR